MRKNKSSASTWDWLISRAVIGWNARVEKGRTRLTDREALDLGFTDHVRRVMPQQALRLSATDIEYALGRFLKHSPSLPNWHRSALSSGGIDIDWSLRQPWIDLDSLASWIVLCNDFEPDATIALDWAKRHPGGSPADDVFSLDLWPTVPRSGDHALRALAKRGLSDMHIHAGGVRLVQQAWIDLMVDRLPARQLRAMAGLYKKEHDVLSTDRRLARATRESLAGLLEIDLDIEKRGMAVPSREEWFSWSLRQLHWERRILIAAWRSLLNEHARADEIIVLLDRYMHLKNRFYRRARQPALAGPRGLRNFDVQHFKALKRDGRIERLPRRRAQFVGAATALPQSRTYAQTVRFTMQPIGDACRYLLESEHLARMELRIAPLEFTADYWRQFKLYKELMEQLKRGHPGREVEIRFAVHFKRSNDTVPDTGPQLFRRLRELDRDTAALRLALADPEKYRDCLGPLARIDVAGQERDTPLNIYALHLRLLRGDPASLDALEEIARRERSGAERFPFIARWLSLVARGQHRPFGWERPLGLTVHAGEDYADALDGLFQIATAVETCGLVSGDSIGHGLALADQMMAPAGGLYPLIPRGAAFDSQCWLYDLLRREGEDDALRSECNRLVDLIEEDGTQIYGRGHNAAFFLDRWRETRLPPRPGTVGDKRPALSDDSRDMALHARREELLDVSPRYGLGRAVKFAQRHLLDQLSRKGIVIELNPSSNLRISGADELADSPTVTLLKESGDSVLVSINTDNPGVFTSVIENEYALLLASMRDGPNALKEKELRALLEGARITGLEMLR